jgi:F-type H+-transporting ATPase subunit delta
VEKALGDHVSELTRNFLFLIVHHRRQNLLSLILDELDNLVNIKRQVLKASLTSARQLSKDQQLKMHQMLQKRTGCTFDIQFRTDPKLLAGFVLVYGETMYDCSTIGALNRFRDTLKSLR